MALYRHVYLDFWNDPKVTDELSAEDRYALLYLLTNPHTTQIGVYTITKRQMAFDLGYSTEATIAILKRFEEQHKLIKYNPETREIAIKNWGKYNLRRGGKPILDCVKSELKKVKDKTLITYVGNQVPNETIKALFMEYREDAPEEKQIEEIEESTVTEDLTNVTLTQSEQKENKKEKENNNDDAKEIIEYLNQKANKNYKYSTKKTKTLIQVRQKEGFTVEDFKKVIDIKCSKWLNDAQMNIYLRPETLFGTKFEGYLNEAPSKTAYVPASTGPMVITIGGKELSY